VTKDTLHGLFQAYRPHGDGVEEVFNGISNSQQYVERLHLVYAATADDACANDAYFVVRRPPPSTPEHAHEAAGRLVSELRHLAVVIGNQELSCYLGQVASAEVVPDGMLNLLHDDNELVQEAIGDWVIGVEDTQDRIPQLREAFYSIACDYWLAYYLQWPYFERWYNRDVFRPYFELWQSGLHCGFAGTTLQVANRTKPIG
jgi:hypothetical protein